MAVTWPWCELSAKEVMKSAIVRPVPTISIEAWREMDVGSAGKTSGVMPICVLSGKILPICEQEQQARICS